MWGRAGRSERPPTRLANFRDPRSTGDDPPPADARGGGAVLPRPLHAVGAGDARAPLAGGQAPRRGADLPGGSGADGDVDRDGHAGGPVASPRRGRLPAGARSASASAPDRLTIAIPARG